MSQKQADTLMTYDEWCEASDKSSAASFTGLLCF